MAGLMQEFRAIIHEGGAAQIRTISWLTRRTSGCGGPHWERYVPPMDGTLLYWDPMPLAAPKRDDFKGLWAERDWRNVPGPFYGAMTDTCSTGRLHAPKHVLYTDEFGQEFVYRQPKSPAELQNLLDAAEAEAFSGYACDGDEHWTSETVRTWWADRARLRNWAVQATENWAASNWPNQREEASIFSEYADYLDGSCRQDLRVYMFWLDHRRSPTPSDRLPPLG
ncbi:ferredoxin [Nonomuraea endophytica]|uniref:ferredoxin n=1 Tax=Nonomuraea endophytica TaxID=714136 RepID=UPI0037CC9384